MTWFIDGSDATVGFRNDKAYVAGTGTHTLSAPLAESTDNVRTISQAEAHWSIHPNTSSELEIDPIGIGFFGRVHATPADTNFSISYYAPRHHQRMAIGFTICLPEVIFADMMSFWRELVFNGKGARYVIALDYECFKTPGAPADNVTFEEWLGRESRWGKLVVGSGVSISFHNWTESRLREP
jgi:hypothetical protein